MIKYLIILCLTITSFSLQAKEQKRAELNKANEAYELLSEELQLQFDFLFLEGVRSKLIGDYQNAIQFFDNCLKIVPQSAVTKYELATILFFNKELNTALELTREAVEENPTNLWYKLLLANIYQEKSMISEACNIYASILEKYPNKEDLYLIEASLYANTEQWEKAITVLNRYEVNFGTTEPVSLEKLKLYSKLKDTKRASIELSKLIKLFPDRSEYLGILAELYFNSGNEKKGLKTIERLMKENPSNGMVQFYLADYYKSKKDEKLYDKFTEEALLNDHISSEIKVQYLLKLIMSGDTLFVNDAKLNRYMGLLNSKYRDDLSIRALYSDFLKKDRKYTEAISELEYIIDQEKGNYLIWEELMMLYNETQQWDQLHRCAKESIKYFPDQPLPYLLVTLQFLTNKEYTSAITLLNEGVKLVDNNNRLLRSQFYAYLGDSYYALNNQDSAFVMFDRALTDDPNNIVVLNNYAYYLTLVGGDLEKAERMSARSVDAESDNPTYLDTYAWILYKRGDYSQALFYIGLAIEKEKNPSGVLFEHYGDILYKSGKIDEAQSAWKKALELNDDTSDQLLYKVEKGRLKE